MSAPVGVCVLGSTGTIGDNTLDVLARHPERFRVVALGARRDHAKLFAQCQRFRPDYAALVEPEAARSLEQALRTAGLPTRVLVGEGALDTLAALPEAPYVMAGIVGAAGLSSSLAAARAGKRLMIANKEPLVMAGPILIEAARVGGATLLPIDSEHNAIFQCWPAGARMGEAPKGVRRILLTASGGPFVDWSAEQIAAATPEQACKHPKWVMGRKISVDSATLMNKGLELIEARILFGLTPPRWTSWCTAKVWCTRWLNTWTARCSPSSARPTCAPRSPTPSVGRSGSTPVYNRSIWPGPACCSSSRPIRVVFPAWRSRARRRWPGALRPPSSMPPTRWPWRHFWRGV